LATHSIFERVRPLYFQYHNFGLLVQGFFFKLQKNRPGKGARAASGTKFFCSSEEGKKNIRQQKTATQLDTFFQVNLFVEKKCFDRPPKGYLKKVWQGQMFCFIILI